MSRDTVIVLLIVALLSHAIAAESSEPPHTVVDFFDGLSPAEPAYFVSGGASGSSFA